MYEHYQYKNIDPHAVYVTGDSHGNWDLLIYKIKEYKIKNAIIIIAGDCGIGFEKHQYYINLYNSMKFILNKFNTTIICMRGNHDDPGYYDGKVINFPYLKAIPDYSIITVGENESQNNIICIGGAISIDRLDRIKRDSNKNKYSKACCPSYWVNEFPVYVHEILDKIYKDGIRINTVITHSAPDFAPPYTKDNLDYWIQNDENLLNDINVERKTLNKIYDHIIKKDNHKVKLWCYGHYHQHILSYSEDNVNFIMLDMMWPKNNSWDIVTIEN